MVTKLDVLTGLDTLRLCTAYRSSEEAELDSFPYHQSVLHHAEAVYEDMPGWSEDITGVRGLDDLPEAARAYLERIAGYVGVPIALIGVGPARDQVVWTGAAPARRSRVGAEPGSSPRRGGCVVRARACSRRAAACGGTISSAPSRPIAASVTCTRQDPLLGPVHVLQLQQQRRLVERQRGTDPERDRQPALGVLAARDQRGAAGRERQHDPRHEVVDVPAADGEVAEQARTGRASGSPRCWCGRSRR